jgi:hypothetical protein
LEEFGAESRLFEYSYSHRGAEGGPSVACFLHFGKKMAGEHDRQPFVGHPAKQRAQETPPAPVDWSPFIKARGTITASVLNLDRLAGPVNLNPSELIPFAPKRLLEDRSGEKCVRRRRSARGSHVSAGLFQAWMGEAASFRP